MKIAATCDIHYDLINSPGKNQKFNEFVKSLEDEKADVLVIAGDTVGLGWGKLKECLDLFKDTAPHRLMVLGNHDYWSADKNTEKHLKFIKKIIKKSGFHLLDAKPKIVENVGFAGNCLWYDYSFSNDSLPYNSSYEEKTFKGRVVWNDAVFVDLNKSDKQYTDELLEKLEKDIKKLNKKTKTIVAVTHHIGFQEMVLTKKENSLWNFANAFMGSKKLGKMLVKHKKVKYHICGHTHRPLHIKKNHLFSINPGSTYKIKRYTTFDIPD